MPQVDLSMIGLEGQAAYDAHKLSQAQTKVQQMAALAKEQEVEAADRESALDQEVARVFGRGAKGESSGVDVPSDESVPESRADALRRAGDMMMQGGAIDRGQELYKAANAMAKQEEDERTGAVDREKKILESQLMSADLVYRYIGTAKNQSEYDNGLQYLLNSPALSPQDKQHLQTLPDTYDPQITRFLADKAVSAKDAAQNKLTERARDQQDRNLENTERYRMDRLTIDRATLQEKKRQNDLAASTGKSASAPNSSEVQSAETAVKNQIFKGDVSDENEIAFKAGAQSIANRAKVLVATNPSINWETAINRAIIESKSNGSWDIVTRRTLKHPFEGETTVEFDNTGTTADLAIPLPVGEGGKPDAKALIPGKYYITVRGRAKWNGKSFEMPE